MILPFLSCCSDVHSEHQVHELPHSGHHGHPHGQQPAISGSDTVQPQPRAGQAHRQVVQVLRPHQTVATSQERRASGIQLQV